MAHDKHCHPFPIEPAPYAPGGECHPCHPDPCCPPRPPRPTPPPPPGCGPSMYVGARYVPKFADPIEWDTERGYESLTIVTYKGESYTSKCPVPPGIDIKNERYWALTGAYNAQVEEYKNQVKDLSEQVTGFASDNKEFRDKITQYDKDNAEMKNSVASTVARVDALAERVDNADAAISDLQAGQAQTVKDIAALEAKDADLQRQISSNDTDISAIQAKDREQDARLSAIETVNDAQAATLTQNTQDIARNTANIQDNAANIAVNSKELAKHAEQLKDHAAQLSVLHKEVTDNHTAIERLTSVTDGLRADLTEDEAKIAQNADAIAHIQQKDVQQDGRLDALENRTTAAEGRLDALDTKTDATNAALTAETTRAKAAELENGKLIAKNAQELAKHADELSDHERRITALETTTDGHTQSIADLKAKDAALDAAIAAVDDKVEHLELIDPKEYAKTIARLDAKDAAQDAIVGDWATAHPDQTITECVASMETEIGNTAADVTRLDADKANKTDIPDVSDFATHAEVSAVKTIADANAANIGQWDTAFPDKTVAEAVSDPTIVRTPVLNEALTHKLKLVEDTSECVFTAVKLYAHSSFTAETPVGNTTRIYGFCNLKPGTYTHTVRFKSGSAVVILDPDAPQGVKSHIISLSTAKTTMRVFDSGKFYIQLDGDYTFPTIPGCPAGSDGLPIPRPVSILASMTIALPSE